MAAKKKEGPIRLTKAEREAFEIAKASIISGDYGPWKQIDPKLLDALFRKGAIRLPKPWLPPPRPNIDRAVLRKAILELKRRREEAGVSLNG